MELTPWERVYFCGQVSLWIESGSVRVLGFVMDAENTPIERPRRLFSPKSTALLYFEAGPDGCILRPSSVDANGLSVIQECQDTFNGIMSAEGDAWCEPVPGFFVLKDASFAAGADFNLLYVSEAWTEHGRAFVSRSSKRPVIFVCGQRKVGKSTFCRFLLNMLLNGYEEVEYVDLDCGQAEFTPSGFVSRLRIREALLGPPFAHLCTPEDSRFLGTANPGELPHLYCRAVDSLKRSLSKDLPVVVNFMGWMTGLGFELLQYSLLQFQPTHIAAFTSQPESVQEDVFLRAYTTACAFSRQERITPSVPQIVYFPDAVPENTRLRASPSDLRSLAFWSYFFSVSGNGLRLGFGQFSFRECALSIASIRPKVIPLSSVQLASTLRDSVLFGVDWRSLSRGAEVTEWLVRVLVMRLVGLACDANWRPKLTGRRPNVAPFSLSALGRTRAFGLGFVSSVTSSEEGVFLHIVTPLSVADLRSHCINTLLFGSLNLPMHMLNASLSSGHDEAPFFSLQGLVDTGEDGLALGSHVHKARHNIKRR